MPFQYQAPQVNIAGPLGPAAPVYADPNLGYAGGLGTLLGNLAIGATRNKDEDPDVQRAGLYKQQTSDLRDAAAGRGDLASQMGQLTDVGKLRAIAPAMYSAAVRAGNEKLAGQIQGLIGALGAGGDPGYDERMAAALHAGAGGGPMGIDQSFTPGRQDQLISGKNAQEMAIRNRMEEGLDDRSEEDRIARSGDVRASAGIHAGATRYGADRSYAASTENERERQKGEDRRLTVTVPAGGIGVVQPGGPDERRVIGPATESTDAADRNRRVEVQGGVTPIQQALMAAAAGNKHPPPDQRVMLGDLPKLDGEIEAQLGVTRDDNKKKISGPDVPTDAMTAIREEAARLIQTGMPSPSAVRAAIEHNVKRDPGSSGWFGSGPSVSITPEAAKRPLDMSTRPPGAGGPAMPLIPPNAVASQPSPSGTVQGGPPAAPPPQLGPAPEQAPSDAAKRIVGKQYTTPQGVLTWLGGGKWGQ